MTWSHRWGRSAWDDQLAMRRMHKDLYPRVKVDSCARIFRRWDRPEIMDQI